MNNYTKLNENQLKDVNGGGYKYYGNGLYVDVKNGSIYVNWAETGNSIVGNLLGSFGGVKYTPGK